MKELTDRLAAIGAPILEEDQVVTLLGSLPRSYSTLVTALEARVADVSLTQQALVQEAQKLKEASRYSYDSKTGTTDSALVGRQKFKPRNIKCYNCGQQGHIRRECPYKDVEPKSSHRAKTAGEESTESVGEGVGAFAASVDSPQGGKWLIDSGASSHMTPDMELLSNYREFEKPEKVSLGDGRTVNAIGVGDVHVKMEFRVSEPEYSVMYQVLHVPKLACNLFSVRAAAAKGNFVKFGQSRCWIRDSSGRLRGMGSLINKLYMLDCKATPSEQVALASSKPESEVNL